MSEIHGAVGSYVVNALDSDELDEFEAHLAVCPTCSREVVEFSETAAELALLAPVVPPPALRASVLSAIKEVRPLPPLAAPAARTEVTTHRTPEQPVASPAQPAGGPVDELALRRQRRRTRVLSLAVAAALVVALSLGGWVFSLVRGQQSQVASSVEETQLFSAPDVQIRPVTTKNGAHVSFVSSKSLNKALFIGRDLPALTGTQTYQLWTTAPTPVRDQAVGGAGGSVKQWFSGSIRDATGLAVSIEPGPNAPAPTDVQGLAKT